MNRESAEKAAREFVDTLNFCGPTQAAAQAIVETHVRNLADIIERAGGEDGEEVSMGNGDTMTDREEIAKELIEEYELGLCNFSGPWTKRLWDALISCEIRVRKLQAELADLGPELCVDCGSLLDGRWCASCGENINNRSYKMFRLNSKGKVQFRRTERPCGETAWVSAAEFADKYGYDLTRLSHLSGRILDFAEAYHAVSPPTCFAWVSAADKLLTYIEAHDWGTIPEPWDSVTPLYELMYTRCPKCQNLDRRGDRTKRDHARMPGFICDDSWHDVNSAVLPSPPTAEDSGKLSDPG